MENKNRNKNHSRMFLSGIFNACRGRVVQKQRSVEDPRLQISGMAPLFDNGKHAFTLIELLVVVLIIGILSAVALPQYQTAVRKARATQLMVAANAIRQAQEAYFLANGEYSLNFNDLDLSISGCSVHESGNTCRAKDFVCYVNDGYADDTGKPIGQAYCVEPNELLYGMANNTGRTYCIAYTSQADQVCKNMGGSSTGGSTYIIP